MDHSKKPFPVNDRQLKSAVWSQLSQEANQAEHSMWPILKMGAISIGILLFFMAWVPLLLSLIPEPQVRHWCFSLGEGSLANVLSALNANCHAANQQANTPILSLLQFVLLVAVFVWLLILMIFSLMREIKHASRYGFQHLIPLHWGYSGVATTLGIVVGAACLLAYCLWLLTTPGFGGDTSRPIVLRSQTALQALYFAFDSCIFALTGLMLAVALYYVAMMSYCAVAIARQKLRHRD
jgi:hypothetical protein